jgi:predicted trehalose synthase
LIGADPRGVRTLLQLYALEKALYEVSYEIANRPDWVELPLLGTLELLDAEPESCTC